MRKTWIRSNCLFVVLLCATLAAWAALVPHSEATVMDSHLASLVTGGATCSCATPDSCDSLCTETGGGSQYCNGSSSQTYWCRNYVGAGNPTCTAGGGTIDCGVLKTCTDSACSAQCTGDEPCNFSKISSGLACSAQP